jgi:hypothetical protein
MQGPLVAAGTWSFGGEATVRYLARCHSLQCCVSAREKGKQWQQTLWFLVMMQQSGLVHEIIAGTVAISACGKVEQWQKALGPGQLCSSLVWCPISSLTALPSVLVGRVSNGSRYSVLAVMHQSGLLPVVITYSVAVSFCKKRAMAASILASWR